MIKLNDYLINFPIPEGVKATKWKLKFKKEGFDSSPTMLKEFLDMCVHIEESEMHKSLAKKIDCVKKEHDKALKEKCHSKSELHH
eukprot:8270771-Ditylum_brightwellii.AAC.1